MFHNIRPRSWHGKHTHSWCENPVTFSTPQHFLLELLKVREGFSVFGWRAVNWGDCVFFRPFWVKGPCSCGVRIPRVPSAHYCSWNYAGHLGEWVNTGELMEGWLAGSAACRGSSSSTEPVVHRATTHIQYNQARFGRLTKLVFFCPLVSTPEA